MTLVPADQVFPSAAFHDEVVSREAWHRQIDLALHYLSPSSRAGDAVAFAPGDVMWRRADPVLVGPTAVIVYKLVAKDVAEPTQRDRTLRELAHLRLVGRGVGEAPTEDACRHALRWVEELRQNAELIRVDWKPPHITSSPDGDVVLEWWSDPRKLTVYVSASSVEYVRSWGPSVAEEMADGVLAGPAAALAQIRWLSTGR